MRINIWAYYMEELNLAESHFKYGFMEILITMVCNNLMLVKQCLAQHLCTA